MWYGMAQRLQTSAPLPSIGEAERDFLRRHPAYADTVALDELRATDYARLDRLGHVYLDYTGGGLYGMSQIERHRQLLAGQAFGNPHSHSPTSLASTELVELARAAVLRFFNADPDEYEVIFAANASGALKLVGEAYPFAPGATYLLSYDNHNSVNGIREFAHARGATVAYLPVRPDDLRLDEVQLRAALERPAGACARPAVAGSAGYQLFAYPAQSNFSGVQHPLEWVTQAQSLGWHVILDCAAFVPTNRLDLREVRPDFVPVSFYKMFGYPTGTGALLARRTVLTALRRPWFAGGTITVASVQGEGWYEPAPPPAGFEDGTVDYLGLPAVTIGLEHLEKIGIETIQARVSCLAGWLLEAFAGLRHSNGAPLVRVFGPQDMDRRGATIAFYVLDPHGHPYDVYGVEAACSEHLISVRTGCFCNPGDGEVAHDLTAEDMARCFHDRAAVVSLMQCQRVIEDATGKVPNTVRVSLGLASNFADVYRLVEFIVGYRDRVE